MGLAITVNCPFCKKGLIRVDRNSMIANGMTAVREGTQRILRKDGAPVLIACDGLELVTSGHDDAGNVVRVGPRGKLEPCVAAPAGLVIPGMERSWSYEKSELEKRDV